MQQQRAHTHQRLSPPQAGPALPHFTAGRKLGFKAVTLTCWCGVSCELAKGREKQAGAFMEAHQDCRPKKEGHR